MRKYAIVQITVDNTNVKSISDIMVISGNKIFNDYNSAKLGLKSLIQEELSAINSLTNDTRKHCEILADKIVKPNGAIVSKYFVLQFYER